jgi:hypothetical protein
MGEMKRGTGNRRTKLGNAVLLNQLRRQRITLSGNHHKQRYDHIVMIHLRNISEKLWITGQECSTYDTHTVPLGRLHGEE